MNQTLKVTLVEGMTQPLTQTILFCPCSAPLLTHKQNSLGWEGIPDMSEPAWDWGKGIEPHLSAEKYFIFSSFISEQRPGLCKVG